jgi:hypothetical protein
MHPDYYPGVYEPDGYPDGTDNRLQSGDAGDGTVRDTGGPGADAALRRGVREGGED